MVKTHISTSIFAAEKTKLFSFLKRFSTLKHLNFKVTSFLMSLKCSIMCVSLVQEESGCLRCCLTGVIDYCYRKLVLSESVMKYGGKCREVGL